MLEAVGKKRGTALALQNLVFRDLPAGMNSYALIFSLCVCYSVAVIEMAVNKCKDLSPLP